MCIYIHNLVYIIYITISIVYSYIYMNGSSCCFEGGWLFYLWGDCTELPISSGSFSSLPVAIGQVSTWLKWQVSKFTNRTVRSRERTAASTSGTVDWSMSQDRGGSQHLQGGVTKLPVQGWGFKPPSLQASWQSSLNGQNGRSLAIFGTGKQNKLPLA